MPKAKIIETTWYIKKNLIITRLKGILGIGDIEQWEKSLIDCLNNIEDHSFFKILIITNGFETRSLEAHKNYRKVVPHLLAGYGWKVGYMALYEETISVPLRNIRGIRCLGAAHTHHDKAKMDYFRRNFDSKNERFFSNQKEARQWIENLDITNL